jgi:type IV pilus assembly protein PilM
MAGELAERRGLTLEHARGWLKHVGLVTELEDVEGDHDVVIDARGVLTDGVQRIADDVRNSMDFHSAQPGASELEHAVLTGPAAAIPGFADQLGQQIALPLEVGQVAEAKAGAFGGAEAGDLAVATGLTVEEVLA